jgi:hypothetical protein
MSHPTPLQKNKEFNATKFPLQNALHSTLSGHGHGIRGNNLAERGLCSDCALVTYLASLVGFGKSPTCCEEPQLVMLTTILRRKQGQKGIRA